MERPVAPERVLILARAPRPGSVKTRLEPLVGPLGAAALHEAFLTDVVAAARRRPATDVVLYHDPEDPGPALRALGVELRPQPGGDLGQRIEQALGDADRAGVERALVLGADSPDLPPDMLDRAFAALLEVPVVIGPAVDGGYWLLGARGVPRALLHSIPWGTESVLAATLEALRKSGLAARLLDVWYDVDRPGDLLFLHAHLRALLATQGEDRCPITRAVLERLLGEPA